MACYLHMKKSCGVPTAVDRQNEPRQLCISYHMVMQMYSFNSLVSLPYDLLFSCIVLMCFDYNDGIDVEDLSLRKYF